MFEDLIGECNLLSVRSLPKAKVGEILKYTKAWGAERLVATRSSRMRLYMQVLFLVTPIGEFCEEKLRESLSWPFS